jgi:hypothetical protein
MAGLWKRRRVESEKAKLSNTGTDDKQKDVAGVLATSSGTNKESLPDREGEGSLVRHFRSNIFLMVVKASPLPPARASSL